MCANIYKPHPNYKQFSHKRGDALSSPWILITLFSSILERACALQEALLPICVTWAPRDSTEARRLVWKSQSKSNMTEAPSWTWKQRARACFDIVTKRTRSIHFLLLFTSLLLNFLSTFEFYTIIYCVLFQLHLL